MKYLSITIHDNDFWRELEAVADFLIDYHKEEIRNGFDITDTFKTRVCKIMNLHCMARNISRDIFEGNVNCNDYLKYFLKNIKIEWTEMAEWDNAETIVIDRYDFKTTII
jgi:hypothetical protein